MRGGGQGAESWVGVHACVQDGREEGVGWEVEGKR